ncbi:hypothetical protein ACEUDE_03065 [Aeromonas veronii]
MQQEILYNTNEMLQTDLKVKKTTIMHLIEIAIEFAIKTAYLTPNNKPKPYDSFEIVW